MNMSTVDSQNLTSSSTTHSSVTTSSSLTSTMEMVRYEDKTLYVWIPCAFFLLAIFITLTISFVEHTKRVLKRKRLLREYVEANVLDNRRRICPMFSSSLSPSRYFLQGWESQPSTNHTETCDGSGRYFAAPEIMLTPDLSGRGGQFLTVPSLTSRVSFRGDGANMLETGDPNSWMPQGGLVYGHSNMGFSFDEDLGRTHAKPLRSPNLSRMHPGSSQLSDNGPSHIRAKGFSSHEDRRATLQNSHCSRSSTSGSSGSYSLASEPERAANDSTFIDNTVQASSTSSGRIFTSSASKDFSPTRTCPHCGSTLPPLPATNTNRAWNLRKNKWRYSRQSACSDFVEMEPGPEAEATVAQFVPDSSSRHSELSGGPQSNGVPTVYCLPGSSFNTGAREHWGTNVTFSTMPFYSVANGEKLSYRSGDGEKTSCEDAGRQKSNYGDVDNEKSSCESVDRDKTNSGSVQNNKPMCRSVDSKKATRRNDDGELTSCKSADRGKPSCRGTDREKPTYANADNEIPSCETFSCKRDDREYSRCTNVNRENPRYGSAERENPRYASADSDKSSCRSVKGGKPRCRSADSKNPRYGGVDSAQTSGRKQMVSGTGHVPHALDVFTIYVSSPSFHDAVAGKQTCDDAEHMEKRATNTDPLRSATGICLPYTNNRRKSPSLHNTQVGPPPLLLNPEPETLTAAIPGRRQDVDSPSYICTTRSSAHHPTPAANSSSSSSLSLSSPSCSSTATIVSSMKKTSSLLSPSSCAKTSSEVVAGDSAAVSRSSEEPSVMSSAEKSTFNQTLV